MPTEGSSLQINSPLAKSILISFIRTEIQRAGFSRGLVSLSGGVDSSLTCYLAAEALGPENVLAVRMPYRTSSPDSMIHAGEVIQRTGVQEITVPITEMVEAYLEQVPEAGKIRQGNVMARMRMLVLYDQSADFNGLVIGTSNKSEILLGYTTLYGDSAYALNPLGDLYKTQVWQLASDMGLPQEILEKPPSADLWEGQTDEGELGFSYRKVDELFLLLVDHRYSVDACIQAGFEPEFVQRVIERVRRNHFKRMMPPVAKLSNRTVGYDFLYLRDWGT